jgi:Zn-dependent alcohol dehydrogenase
MYLSMPEFMFYFSTDSGNLLCSIFQRAALDCTTVGWGSCTVVGVKPGDKDLDVSPVDLIVGRTMNGTFFGG